MILSIFLQVIFCCLIVIDYIYAEVFTSMHDISKLVKTEDEFLQTVDEYIQIQEKNVHKLKE